MGSINNKRLVVFAIAMLMLSTTFLIVENTTEDLEVDAGALASEIDAKIPVHMMSPVYTNMRGTPIMVWGGPIVNGAVGDLALQYPTSTIMVGFSDPNDRSCIYESSTAKINWYCEATLDNQNGDPKQVVKVYSNDTLKKYVPEKAGYIFKGWYTNPECTNPFDFNKVTTGDVNVYAGWESTDMLMVKFITGDGATSIENQYLDVGSKVKMPMSPSKYKFIFGGWYTESSYINKFDPSTPITKNTELYAKWISELRFLSNPEEGYITY